MSVEINLTHAEILSAAICGTMRQVENLKLGRPPAHGADDKHDWQKHCEGCLGERTLAKYLNLYWTGKGILRDHDVGNSHEAKTTWLTHMPLHHDSQDDRRYWFVQGINGRYHVLGWIWGKDGKQERYWCDLYKNKRPAFFIPPGALHPAEQIELPF